MSIQIDNGDFTRIHNDILDGLAQAHLSALEFRCVVFLVRMTYGWQKKEDAISLSQWADGLGIDRSNRGNILNILNSLVAEGVIYIRSNGNNKPATWGINKSYFEKPSVMSLDNTSVMQPHNSDEQTVMQPHNTSVMQPHNKTVMWLHNHQRKKEIVKKEGESAPARIASPEPATKAITHKSRHLDPRHFVNGFIPAGTGLNAVEVYYERFSINQDSARLNSIKEDDLVRLCPDLNKLRDVIVAYSRTAYIPGNIQLILDWYRDGPPDRQKQYSNGTSPPASEAKKAAIATAAKLARQSIRTAEQFGGQIDPAWTKAIETAKEHGV